MVSAAPEEASEGRLHLEIPEINQNLQQVVAQLDDHLAFEEVIPGYQAAALGAPIISSRREHSNLVTRIQQEVAEMEVIVDQLIEPGPKVAEMGGAVANQEGVTQEFASQEDRPVEIIVQEPVLQPVSTTLPSLQPTDDVVQQALHLAGVALTDN